MDSRYLILLKYRRRMLRKHQNFPRDVYKRQSSSSAKISAYAGKALVIVRSTKDAGSFTLTASASGLSGGSVTVITTEDPDAPKQDGLISYAFVRDYSVKAGTVPILSTEATGLMADGTEITGTIVWDEIPVEYVETAGDYTINGTLTFSGLEPIKVTARLHVIGNVVAMLNVSTVTTPGTVPKMCIRDSLWIPA